MNQSSITGQYQFWKHWKTEEHSDSNSGKTTFCSSLRDLGMLIQSDKVAKQEQYFKNFQNGNILRHQWWRHQLKLLSPCNLHVNLIPIIWQKKLPTTFIQGLKVNIESTGGDVQALPLSLFTANWKQLCVIKPLTYSKHKIARSFQQRIIIVNFNHENKHH